MGASCFEVVPATGRDGCCRGEVESRDGKETLAQWLMTEGEGRDSCLPNSFRC